MTIRPVPTAGHYGASPSGPGARGSTGRAHSGRTVTFVRQAKQPAERLTELVRQRLAPALAEHGFRRRSTAFVADRGEVRWLVDVELAPWSKPGSLCATMAWGVHVPGLAAVLDDRAGVRATRPWACPVHGRAGEGAGDLAASWHSVRAHWWPLDHVAPLIDVLDARTAVALVHDVTADVLPHLRALDSIADVQARLARDLDRHPRTTSTSDLAAVRTIFALSVLQGERENARRWLDYLEARSARTMAPDLVAERLASLRQHCLT